MTDTQDIPLAPAPCHKSIMRRKLEEISDVTRTWFELTLENGELSKILVVEIDFDTDPNASADRNGPMDEIRDTYFHMLNNYTMRVDGLKIIPRGLYDAGSQND